MQVKQNLLSDWISLPNTPIGNAFVIPIDSLQKTQFYRVAQRSSPIILRIIRSGGNLVISANVSLDGYELQVKQNLSSPTEWITLPNTPVGNAFIVPIDSSQRTQVYRVRQRTSSSSIILRATTSGSNLILSGSSSLQGFDLEASDSLSSSGQWTVLPIALVGNQFIVPIDFSKKFQFYRLKQRFP
ncbi:MAG: hypothetical protein DME26_08760 [Verrucomicrobia bacterium]|nr:MAG: hypothetical protein DME26_08760 [Verrucomicrobiota bacterium]